MKPISSKYASSLLLHCWPWLKIGFYIFYFLFMLLINNVGSSPARFFVIMFFLTVAIGIVEMGLYCLQQVFRKKRYKRAIVTFSGSYMALVMAGYYILHGSRNIVATEILDRQVEASWSLFLLNFNEFFWTFFKYSVILFLIRQTLLLIRLLETRKRTDTQLIGEIKVMPGSLFGSVDRADAEPEAANVRSITENSQFRTSNDDDNILSIKIGTSTHMLAVCTIVYLEVQDEITTVYQIDGSKLKVKVSLSKFHERLPKDRFIRIHESRVVALPYIIQEKQDGLHMQGYEKVGLKLGKSRKYVDAYKKWKERNRLV